MFIGYGITDGFSTDVNFIFFSDASNCKKRNISLILIRKCVNNYR